MLGFAIVPRHRLDALVQSREDLGRQLEESRALLAGARSDHAVIKRELQRALEGRAAEEERAEACLRLWDRHSGEVQAAVDDRDNARRAARELIAKLESDARQAFEQNRALVAGRAEVARKLDDATEEVQALRAELLEALRQRDAARAALERREASPAERFDGLFASTY
jgi:chromosome segregation ATPase